MSVAAQQFLAALDEKKRSRVTLPFESEERFDWSYVPRSRGGVALKEMTESERRSALALLATGLSAKGVAKTTAIRELEEVLRAQSGWSMRDPGLYNFTVFGNPDAAGAWGFRYEGHHASLHWTVAGGRIAGSAPQFLGANPADIRDGPRRGVRALASEEDLARTLVRALSPAQRAPAVVSDRAPSDIASRGARSLGPPDGRGVAHRDLTPDQQRQLLALVEEYASAQTEAVATERMARVRAEVEGLRFAWMGGLEKGQGHYYRIESASFLIEYDNTQDGANHIHSVWRDRHSDWGGDLLAEHYRTAPHHRKAAAALLDSRAK